jgi:phosphoribosylglycinamide formyltransferase 1
MSQPILLLAGDGTSSRAVFHALDRANLGTLHVVLENKVPRSELVRRRMRKLGALKVAGQIAFMASAQPVLSRRSQARIRHICEQYGLEVAPIPEPVTRVATVNDDAAREAIARIVPAVVVVNGTRILSKQTLGAFACPAINMHAGITPRYRGVHGGYWALVEGRPELAGTTVHLVDAGIDTGGIIGQATFEVSADDSFATYPYLHTAAGIPLLIDAVRAALAGTLQTRDSIAGHDSKLRTHPTIWEYVGYRMRRGVK